MKKKSFTVADVMAAEIRFARHWLEDAQKQFREAKETLEEARSLPVSDGGATLMREAALLCREAEENVRFFDGVLSGMLVMEKAVSERAPIGDVSVIKKK